MNELYKRIEAAAVSRGMTVGGAADRAGVSRGRLSALRNGDSETLSAANLKKMSDVLGVSVNYLLYGEETGRFVHINLDKTLPNLRPIFEKFTERELVFFISEMTAELQRRKEADRE